MYLAAVLATVEQTAFAKAFKRQATGMWFEHFDATKPMELRRNECREKNTALMAS